jgi:hypothetical protein
MSSRRRSFRRPLGERRYRKLFVIAVEGVKTEPQYFEFLNNLNSNIWIYCVKGKRSSSPPQVLGRMTEYLREKELMESDEAWLVVDRDSWTEDQLQLLHNWTSTSNNYGFALSNPTFEYWLLLHFEDASGISNSSNCLERLRRYLPDYDKGINTRKITRQMIEEAIGRAKHRDFPPCSDWPRNVGTTVYKLVQNLL